MKEEIGVFEAIHSLRAIRDFAPDPLPDDVIPKLLDAAIRAPSPQNTQPWAFVVVRDDAARAKVAEIYRKMWGFVKEPVYGDIDAIEDPAKRRLIQATDRLATAADQAPVFVFAMLDRSRLGNMVTPDLETVVDPSSAYGCVWGAVQNLVLAARALGIGAITTTLTKFLDDEVRAITGHPKHVETVTMIALGYPRAPARFGPTTRRPISDCAHVERWGEAI
jgi:nitroreductase